MPIAKSYRTTAVAQMIPPREQKRSDLDKILACASG